MATDAAMTVDQLAEVVDDAVSRGYGSAQVVAVIAGLGNIPAFGAAMLPGPSGSPDESDTFVVLGLAPEAS